MALNDMRTLRSKVDLMSRNTMRVAKFLEEHPAVESVAVSRPAEPSAARTGQPLPLARRRRV